MPSFCEYKNCHNLASSTWNGYCNEYHFLRAQLEDAKERVRQLEEKIKKLQEMNQG
jgi:5-bromo-4-chloroindolyl phosphate hydrolysis protein